jgi:cell wall-associated NlpC family hydrolase
VDRGGGGAVTGAGWARRAAVGVAAISGGCATVLVAGVQAAAPAPLAATAAAATDIPADYQKLYVADAERCPGLSWTVLAAVGKVESDHGRDPGPSPAGAIGPMQFEPSTWRSYGVDGDGDGRADPRDPADAIPAAADYLCALGVGDAPRDALVAYNCGDTGARCQSASAGYAAAVLGWAARYGAAPLTGPVAAGPFGQLAVRVALDQVGTPYIWGGEEPGGFDCSGLVQYSYAAAGLALPRVAQDQYDAGPVIPAQATLVAGDLLFFGGGADAVTHVGIYLGDGRMVDAPHSGALVRVEPVDLTSPSFVGATRPDAAGGVA